MSLSEFLTDLRSKGVNLSAKGGQLRCTAPHGVLTLGLQKEISRHKAGILAVLGAGFSADQGSLPIPSLPNDFLSPLSYAQQRLWFLDTMDPGSCTFNMSAALRLTGRIDIAAMGRALRSIVKRHEILRTTFPSEDGQPFQCVTDAPAMVLQVVDLRAASATDRESGLRGHLQGEVCQPFELARGPLFRARMMRMEDTDNVLILNVHHIVFDRWSLTILLRELAAIYEVYATGQPSPLGKLLIQYSDYARFQRNWLQGGTLERQLVYWRRQLDGNSPVLQLPNDRTPPLTRTHRGARQPVSFPEGLAEKMDASCRRERATRFMVLLAMFKVLLYRYSAQEDIVVGTPTAGRTRIEHESLIGLFVNTLVIRTSLSGNPTFRECLARVRDVVLEALAHQDVPFEKLVDELRPERSMSHSPLFQIMFSYHNQPPSSEFLGASCRVFEVYNETAKYDLTLELSETPGGLKGWFEYNTDLFDSSTMARMAGHMETLVCSLLDDPDQRVMEIPLLQEAERQQMLGDWSATEGSYPRDQGVIQLFEAQVERTPHAVAVVHRGQTMTYLELNQRSNQLAHRLRTLNVGPGIAVAICIERSLEMVIGLLGILKAGGAYVPLDPSVPAERLLFMVAEVKASVVLVRQELARQMSGIPGRTVLAVPDGGGAGVESCANLTCEATGDNLVYVVFTSGSTGQPKGSGIYMKGFVNLLSWYTTEFRFGAGDKVLLVSNPSFDLTQKNVFSPLLVGAQLHVSDSSCFDPGAIVEAIARDGITIVNCTPGMFYSILDADNSFGLARLASLRCVFLGGEAVVGSRLAKLEGSKLSDTLLVNTYGPAECTDVCAYHVVRNPGRHLEERIPIGKSIPNSCVVVLDPNLGLLPSGLVGEICVGGVCVGCGYVNDDALTRARFVDNPYRELPGKRLYRTGDLGRRRADGTIEFLGRADHQVKIRGVRVELGEVEAVLEQHSQVSQCLVVNRTGEADEGGLVAYVVADKKSDRLVSELRDLAKRWLPGYMVPSAFVLLGALPLTPNGKVDRQSLPHPGVARPDLEAAYVPARTPTEKTLLEIWTSVLSIEQIGVHDNFFDLGGNSLLLVQVSSRMRAVLVADVRVADLFRFPTVSSLAEYLDDPDSTDRVRKSAVRLTEDRARRQQASLVREGQHARSKGKNE